MRRFNIGYFFVEGFQSIFTHGLMSFAAVCMIICCLLIMGSFSLVAVNLDNMLGDFEKQNEFLAYIDETYTEEQARALEEQILAIPNVASAEFMSRGQAKEEFAAKQEETELFESLPDTVLRDRFRIHVNDLNQLRQTVEQVKGITGVAETSAAYEVAEGFTVVRNVASGVAVILVAILLLVSLFIITNTIKLATFNRREEIAIMKMCGATNGFVRWPFVFEGLILGLVGALLAYLIQWGVYTLIGKAINASDTMQLITILPFEQMAMMVLGVFLGTGFVIGVGGSLMAIRKFLQV
ncbi:permease-like cell division protein FtsX [Pseudoflavonifractor gallinarum]|uniref:Cell division protein FtsX n=1 Tax=Pseudoflavonifractor hominis TaxID=2763059 RepID=A0ABR7HQ64_9FIRM|nr:MULTISPECIES: permease-like cell division protein FtsX [Pseudoflavonifractor]MBC5729666.1 ABC transporter permease [Pseudoflavonifractor hominis]MBT9685229.1 FtsX-like permease family protein [Pseudoflavonifractor sp. MCC625]